MLLAVKRLSWTQRVALIRHNLHTASRSGDYTFFRTFQACALLDGTNHVATLIAAMGDEADTILAAFDDLNTGIAYIHQDAFKRVYDNLKSQIRDGDPKVARSQFHVDVAMQKKVLDGAIDKVVGSAIALLNQQPENVQDTAANVWVSGAILVADAMEICNQELDRLEDKLDDFIRLEEAWTNVKGATVFAIMGLKGVFSFLETANANSASDGDSTRSASITSAGSAMFRRLSNAFTASAPQTRSPSVSSGLSSSGQNDAAFNRNGSISSISSSSIYRTPNYVRSHIGNTCPMSMPASTNFTRHSLDTIPPTPAHEVFTDPFEKMAPPVPNIPVLAAE